MNMNMNKFISYIFGLRPIILCNNIFHWLQRYIKHWEFLALQIYGSSYSFPGLVKSQKLNIINVTQENSSHCENAGLWFRRTQVRFQRWQHIYDLMYFIWSSFTFQFFTRKQSKPLGSNFNVFICSDNVQEDSHLSYSSTIFMFSVMNILNPIKVPSLY